MTSASLNWVAAHIKLNPPESFYYDLPRNYIATFSTKCGKLPKRPLPRPAPPPLVRSDVDADIRSMATSLRQEFPGIVREIYKPASWHELYKYFDAVDLWYEGAAFLFYVLNHIGNENISLDHELEESKHKEISNWAKLWVKANVKRVLGIPPTQDLISIFDDSELHSIHGLERRQTTVLRQELNIHRKEYEYLLAPPQDARMHGPQQSFQHMPQPDHPYHPVHQQVPQCQPMTQPGIPPMQQGPPMAGRLYPMAVDESRRNQMMPMQPMQPLQPMHHQVSPSHIPYNTLMENRGQLPLMPQVPTGPVDFRQDAGSQWGRQRGYSNETARSGRGRGNAYFNNFAHKNRSTFAVNDRRMVANNATPRGSPLRRLSLVNPPSQSPIYVYDSQHQSPHFDGDATPRASGRSMIQNNQRIVSDPSNDRTPFPNSARLWRERPNSKPQDIPDVSPPTRPFEGNPQAFFMENGYSSSCTFWYEGETRRPDDFETSRTLYVQHFPRDEFETHKLKERFAKYGKVESISFLWLKPRGPAFVAFADEGCREAAITGLNNCQMPNGQFLVVKVPRLRDRSGSQSSSQYNYEPNHCSDFERDNYSWGSSRRGSVRNPSVSYRASNYSAGDDRIQVSSNSSDLPSPSHAPLTVGFQAQLQASQPLPMQHAAGPLNSSLAEVVQHQVAINRFSNQNQTSLSNIENYSNAYNKDNIRTHSRNFSNNGVNQPHMVMSQGSYNRKENSPTKMNSSKNTPFTSPKKDLSRPQGAENNQKGNGGKKNNKGNKQNSSTRPSRAPSPTKFDIAMLTAMQAEENDRKETPTVMTPDVDTPIPEAQKVEAPKVVSSMAETPKVVIPVKNGENPSMVDTEKPHPESSATKTTANEKNVGFLIYRVDGLRLEIPATNAKDSSHKPHVSVIEFKPTVEQPVIASPKPKIEAAQVTPKNDSTLEKVLHRADTSKSEPSEISAGADAESKPKKKNINNGGSKKSKKRKSNAKSDAGQSSNSLASKDSSETLKSSFMTESTEHFVTAQSSPNPSLTSGPSETCLCADDPTKSIAADDATISSPPNKQQPPIIKHSKTDSNATATSTPKTTTKFGKKQRQNHSKNDSNSSTISTGSVPEAGKKSVKSGKKVDENSKPEDKEVEDLQKEDSNPSSPAVNFEDSMQWPSLAPAKTPVVDGKPPAVATIQPLSERKKNPNAPIIPAVPLNMQRRHPSIDQSAWPLVKSWDTK